MISPQNPTRHPAHLIAKLLSFSLIKPMTAQKKRVTIYPLKELPQYLRPRSLRSEIFQPFTADINSLAIFLLHSDNPLRTIFVSYDERVAAGSVRLFVRMVRNRARIDSWGAIITLPGRLSHLKPASRWKRSNRQI